MRSAIESAREQVAQLLGAADTSEIVFTSCGSESDNWAIRGALEQNARDHVAHGDGAAGGGLLRARRER